MLTTTERWKWHAEVYAFRRVVMKVPPEERVSPCDPNGVWFNEELVGAAVTRLDEKLNGARRRRERIRNEGMRREGRELCDRWARRNGYADIDDALAAGRSYADVLRSYADFRSMPREPRSNYVAESLGATAHEFRPSPEKLAADRHALVERGYLEAEADEEAA